MAEHHSKVILNGHLLARQEANVPISSRGLMYGDGCFETVRSYKGRFLKLSNHLERLQAGLRFLSIPCPTDLLQNKINATLKTLLAANKLSNKEAVTRIQVWRKGRRGYTPQSSNDACYSALATPFVATKKPAQLATVDIKRVPSAAVPARYKLSNGINYITAAQKAAQQNADDALLETVGGYVSETTIANIFWLKDDIVYTPSIKCDILPGVTRTILLNILEKELHQTIHKGTFRVEALKQADAVWICNSLKEIQPVSGIDDYQFDLNHPFIQALIEAFVTFRNEKLEA